MICVDCPFLHSDVVAEQTRLSQRAVTAAASCKSCRGGGSSHRPSVNAASSASTAGNRTASSFRMCACRSAESSVTMAATRVSCGSLPPCRHDLRSHGFEPWQLLAQRRVIRSQDVTDQGTERLLGPIPIRFWSTGGGRFDLACNPIEAQTSVATEIADRPLASTAEIDGAEIPERSMGGRRRSRQWSSCQ
jgi:hypothetical protein